MPFLSDSEDISPELQIALWLIRSHSEAEQFARRFGRSTRRPVKSTPDAARVRTGTMIAPPAGDGGKWLEQNQQRLLSPS
jgi:hypothetical protein